MGYEDFGTEEDEAPATVDKTKSALVSGGNSDSVEKKKKAKLVQKSQSLNVENTAPVELAI